MNPEKRESRGWHRDSSPNPKRFDSVPTLPPDGDTVNILRDLARAIAADERAMLITPGNDCGGWCSLEEAIGTGEAFAVRRRADLVALDADRVETIEVVEQLAPILVDEGFAPVLVASGRGRHLFVRVLDGSRRAEIENDARARGIDVRDVIRPPLSPHRLGLPVGLIDVDVAEALNRLRPVRPERAVERERLSGDAYRLLRRGDERGAYGGDRSRVVQAIATAAVNAGWTESQTYSALLDARHEGGEKVQEIDRRRGELAARHYVRTCFTKAERYVRDHPAIRDRAEALAGITRRREAVAVAGWSGTAASYDRRVLEVILDVATNAASIRPTFSERQIAEAAGITRSTVQRALGALAGRWIERESSGYGPRGSTWKLLEPPGQPRSITNLTEGGVRANGPSLSPRHDAFRTRGLGTSPLLVFDSLDVEEATTLEQLAILGLHRRTIRRALDRLTDFGLVTTAAEGWVRVSDDVAVGLLDEAAQQLGTAGDGERQRLRHEGERRAYRAWLAHRAEHRRASVLPIVDVGTGEIILAAVEPSERRSHGPPRGSPADEEEAVA